jgi:hypothetical protein
MRFMTQRFPVPIFDLNQIQGSSTHARLPDRSDAPAPMASGVTMTRENLR